MSYVDALGEELGRVGIRGRLRALGSAGTDEGPRNAAAEVILVVGCFAALGRRLGLRR